MHIYIDESGSFIPGAGGSRFSCGAALVIPHTREAQLAHWTGKLLARWDSENSSKELKGSALSEIQARALIELVRPYDPLLIVVLIDAGNHSDAEIQNLIAAQANNITANLTDKHHPNLVKELTDLKGRWEALSLQLAIQAFTFFTLTETVLRMGTLYYAQRIPAELGVFRWVLDAKDPARVTPYEEVWSDLLKPFLQATFMTTPLDAMEGADYSAYRNFDFTEELPEETKKRIPAEELAAGNPTDLRKIMSDLRFESSNLIGLRLVDMFASIVRRAFSGKLRIDGWRYAGRLMVCKQPIVKILELSAISRKGKVIEDETMLSVLSELTKHCKGMVA